MINCIAIDYCLCYVFYTILGAVGKKSLRKNKITRTFFKMRVHPCNRPLPSVFAFHHQILGPPHLQRCSSTTGHVHSTLVLSLKPKSSAKK